MDSSIYGAATPTVRYILDAYNIINNSCLFTAYLSCCFSFYRLEKEGKVINRSLFCARHSETMLSLTLRVAAITQYVELQQEPCILGGMFFFFFKSFVDLNNFTSNIIYNIISYICRYGEFGQLGHGDYNNEFTPLQVQSLAGVRVGKVACGSCHTVAILRSGDVYVWGKGSYVY